MKKTPQLVITSGPFLKEGTTTTALMWEVVLVLIPVIIVSAYFFGITALLIVGATTLSAVITEWFFQTERKMWGTLKNGSALLTGILLGLTLPPTVPLWMACLGGFMSIALGKLIWGGLGGNMFNPALLGRAFLQASFPSAMTTWSAPISGFFSLNPQTFAFPFMRVSADGFSAATPLGQAKFEGVLMDSGSLFWGSTGGSLGETSALILILCGLWLGIRKVFDWRLCVSTLVSVAVFSFILNSLMPETAPSPVFMLLSGGLLFGAVFMVTDPVTTPVTGKGMWIFGVGTGTLVVLIRVFGGLAEGVMFAILFMNALTPLINRYTQPKPFGGN